ncbi:P-loop containing nucleoside triphosphate hydrolase protein [Rhodotorula toruloides]|nr:P-loop containing nucleoside triphosphate hydrolase protein [Rhodotorula toruloides]
MDLRSAGASTEIDLPRIAVIGNQSAGKSSLVEAISGIKVPRDAGTCTRCPMDIRLRSSPGEWTCRIFLRFETDTSGRPVESVREIPFGDAVTNPDAVEAILRRAQLAILNPQNSDKKFFLNLSDDEVALAKRDPVAAGLSKQLSFSTNLICIDVTGPVTDLAFLDLPGIIANSDEPDDITLIENMVRQSITGNCLILLTITMRDDFQNQKAVLLAKEADPDGKRTIGVLTKPDTLQTGEHPTWLDLLENRRHHLSNGYFVTKQPAPDDLIKNLTYKETREAEKEYFERNEPWRSLEVATRRRLGIGRLTGFLSDRLRRYIAENVARRRLNCADSPPSKQTSLPPSRSSPPPSSDPINELHTRLASLSHDLDLLVQGSTGFAELVQAKNREDRRFKAVVKGTRPVFVPFEKVEKGRIREWEKGREGEGKKAKKQRTSRGAEESAGAAQGATLAPALQQQQQQQSGEPCATTTPKFSDLVSGLSAASTSLKRDAVPEAIVKPSLRMTLDEIRAHIEAHKGREVPLNTPYGAKSSLMLKALEPWPALVRETLERVREPVEKAADELVKRQFGSSLNEELRSITSMTISDVLDDLFTKASSRLDDILELEGVPFTQNQHYFVSTRDEVLADLRKARQGTAGGEADQEMLSEALAALAAIGYRGLKEEDSPKLLPGDVYEEELEAAAQTVAYWKVAYKRIVDDVPRIIYFSIIRRLPSSISHALLERLVSGGDGEIRRLMSESPEVAEQRAELNMRKKRLEEAKKVLLAFGRTM